MKKTVSRKMFAVVMAAACAISAGTALAVSANGAWVSGTAVSKSAAKVYKLTLWGSDWTYYIDSTNVKISCDMDFSKNTCTFKAEGIKTGVTNAVLKVKVCEGKWKNFPVALNVDKALNVTGKISGDYYYTAGPSSEPVKSTETNTKTNTYKETKSTGSTAVGKPCTYTMKGEDWTYKADSLNVRITCDFTYSTSTCKFRATGVKPGVTNAVLKAQRSDGKWNNVPVRFTVDDSLNVTGKQTAKMYVTEN